MSPDRKARRLRDWIEARRRHRLSSRQVQMARELGLNPATLGKLDNYKQEGWKLPLPAYIEHLHLKRFGKSCPAAGASLEERGKPVERKAASQSDSTQPVLDLFAAGPSGERTPELDDGA